MTDLGSRKQNVAIIQRQATRYEALTTPAGRLRMHIKIRFSVSESVDGLGTAQGTQGIFIDL